ncbi:calcium-activated chloride channel regulator 4-like [Saccoglossus kowalevskii]|uniref:Calcium-activated chloride channel regulator 4-like n=1 Tax=Saccoglossus kowalevskii TaxID=10224 RepID=A0ABM0M9K5_SACKO|nr:PREDICTED: calcium-activated chloride channel regulator 4-like [Saccoglossus kowalevskii]
MHRIGCRFLLTIWTVPFLANSASNVVLENNGYNNVLIAIHNDVDEVDGLLNRIKILESNGADPTGGTVVLITDGTENEPPMISTVINTLVGAGVVVSCIGIGPEADEQLAFIASETGGSSYHHVDEDSVADLSQIFNSVEFYRSNSDWNMATLQIYSETIILAASDVIGGNFYIDSTIGEGTTMTVFWKQDSAPIDLTINDPDNDVIDDSYSGYEIKIDFKMVEVRIAGVAKTGRWEFHVTNPTIEALTLSISVNSKPTEGSTPPLHVSPHILVNKVNFTDTPSPMMIISAEVLRGYDAVINANVTAILRVSTALDDGTVTEVSTLTLKDNGAGGDLHEDDGIYCAFFTSYSIDGKYNIKIIVNNEDASAGIVYDAVRNRGPEIPTDGEPNEPITEPAEQFTRIASAGYFSVSDLPPNMTSHDWFAPSKVTDLKVTNISSEERTAVLSWTATGDDYDQGTASFYDIRFSSSFSELRNSFESTSSVEGHHGIVGGLHAPQNSGNNEVITLVINNSVITGQRVCVALQAVDDSGHKSETSNIVSIVFHSEEPMHMRSDQTKTIILASCITVSIVVTIIVVLFIIRQLKMKASIAVGV